MQAEGLRPFPDSGLESTEPVSERDRRIMTLRAAAQEARADHVKVQPGFQEKWLRAQARYMARCASERDADTDHDSAPASSR